MNKTTTFICPKGHVTEKIKGVRLVTKFVVKKLKPKGIQRLLPESEVFTGECEECLNEEIRLMND